MDTSSPAPQSWKREAERDRPTTEADRHDASAERYSLPGSHACHYETIRNLTTGESRDLCMRCGSPAPE